MKTNWFQRTISMMLVMVLLWQSIPVQSLAANSDNITAATSDGLVNTETTTQQIVGEEISLREEDTKHFRLSDGSYIAVSYGMPVHYMDSDGDWQDIDNSPVMATAGDSEVYQISNAGISTAFNSDLSTGDLMTASYGNVSVKMSLLDTEQAVTYIETDSVQIGSEIETEPEPAPEVLTTETNAATTFVEAENDAANSEALSEEETDAKQSGVDTNSVAEVADEHMNETESVIETQPEINNEETGVPTTDIRDDVAAEEETSSTSSAETESTLPPVIDPEVTQGQEELETESVEQAVEEYLVFDRMSEAILVGNSTTTLVETKEHTGWTAEDLWPENFESSILYEDVYPGVDLLYTAFGYDVKEQIIVNEKQSIYRYDFLLELNGLTAVLNEDGSISLTNDAGAAIYTIPAPYMEDADGNISYDVTYTLTEIQEGVILTVEAKDEWINKNGRTFPVKIDPSLVIDTGWYAENIYACYAKESDGKGSGQSGYLYTGYGSATKELQAFLHFSSLPSVPNDAVIVGASLQLFMLSISPEYGRSLPLGLYEVTSENPRNDGSYYDWFKYDLNWNNKPTYDTANLIDYVTLTPSNDDEFINWDMTELVKQWYAESKTCGTIALCMADAEYTTSNPTVVVFSALYSVAAPPLLIVSYRNNTGIESYYTYSTFDVGQAGTVFIADATGQSKVVKEVASYASTVNPFSLNLVYNSDYFATDNTTAYHTPTDLGLSMKLGAGWTLDVIQRVVAETISGTSYIRYHDGDGTIHYFVKNSDGKYYDEDGLGLKIASTSTNKYTMSDDQDNKWIFVNSYLTEIEDNNGNKYTINYSNGQITSIVQTNKSSTAVTVASFEYNSDNYVTKITDANNKTVELGYDNDKLKEVKKNYTLLAKYEYPESGYRINKIIDLPTEYTLELSYEDSQNHVDGKVVSYNEDSESNTTGAACRITYPNSSKTVYQDYGNDRTLDTDDDIITHYLFDYAGRTVNAYTTDVNGKVLGASNAVYTGSNSTDKKNNRVQRSATIGIASQQLLDDFGFEAGPSNTKWSLTNTEIAEVARTGNYALKGYRAAGNTTMISAQCSTAILEAGKIYTYSAYLNTSEISNFSSNGIRLLVWSPQYDSWKSDYLGYQTSANVDGGWIRYSVTFTATVAGSYTIGIVNHGAEGTFYVDDIQLEEGSAPSSCNLLENGNMSTSNGWTFGDGCSYDSGRLKITGSAVNANTQAYQDVPINLKGSETFVLSGWVQANAVPDTVTTGDPDDDDEAYAKDTEKQCGLRAIIYYSDDTTEYHYVAFNSNLSEKQFVSMAVVPKSSEKTVSKIRVVCAYEKNANIAYFDDISLVREAAQTMKYDDDGNLISVTSTGQGEETSEYDSNNNLIKLVTNGSGTYEYTYDSTFKHRPESVTNSLITQTMTYDGVGNVETSTLKDATGSSAKTLQSSSQYTNNGNQLSAVTDSNGITTAYEYSGTQNKMYGIPSKITDAKGNAIEQVVDNFGRITQMSFYANDKVAQSGYLQYNYNAKFQLESIARSINYGFEKYLFQYDDFGNMTSIIIGNSATATGKITLVTYEYGAKNGPLEKQTYGNGDSVSYTYDNLGRVATVTSSDERVLTYTYNGEGALHSIHDSKDNVTYLYVYDSIGRLINSVKNNSTDNSLSLHTQQEYNDSNQLTGQNWQIGTTSYSEAYTYNKEDGSLNTMTTATGQTVNYSYDALRRLSSVDNGKYSYSYTYRDISSTQTTTQVETLSYSGITGALDFGYTYDELGNIKTYTDFNGSQSYTYDELGQLTQAVVGSTTYTYTYDFCGNITSANGKTYTYGNSQWKDLLTSYDGQTISYDGSGNPTNYYNGTSWTFGWAEGRNLVTASGNGKEISYTYDHEGVRTSKTVDGTVHNYIYASGKLLREIYDGTVIDFFYDANGRPYAMTQNGTTYYYVLNLQGDVLGVMDGSGNIVAKYKYDPYGNLLNTSGIKADIYNPLRYRGYYYDTESNLYYLQSRYYDPAIGRFINADDASYLGIDGSLLSYNSFAYCQNSPVIAADKNGKWLNIVIGAAVGAAASAITTYVNGGSPSEIILSGVCGAASGAFAATGLGGVLGQVVVGALTSAIDSGYQNYNKYNAGKQSLGEAIASTLVDTAMGVTFGAMGFEGTDALKHSNKISNNAMSALKTLSKKGLHPSVKSTAKTALRQGWKYIVKETKTALLDNALTSVIGNGVSEAAQLFY